MEPQLEYEEGVTWVDLQRDLRAFVDYRRKRQLTFAQWRSSLKGSDMRAIYSAKDPGPGVAHSAELVAKLGERIVHRVADSLGSTAAPGGEA